MKIRIIYTLLIAGSLLLLANANGRVAISGGGATGAPGETGTSCGDSPSCHQGTAFGTSLEITLKDASGADVTEYIGGEVYTASVKINTTGSPQRFGFNLTSLIDSDNSSVNGFSNPSTNTKISTASTPSGRQYAEQASFASNEFTVDWTAPAGGSGPITMYAGGAALNGNGSPAGDDGTTMSVTINEKPNNVNDILAKQVTLTTFPNPVVDQLNIRTVNTVAGTFDITLFNMVGAQVAQSQLYLSQGENLNTIDMSQLNTGNYILKITQDGNSITKKVLKL